MVLRIIRSPKGKEEILYGNGRSACVTSERLWEILLNQASAYSLSCDGPDWWELDNDRMEDVEGVTLAYIDDKGNLVVTTDNPFLTLLSDVSERNIPPVPPEEAAVDYISVEEYANTVGRHPSRIRILCRDGRFPTAKKIGGRWVIPKGTPFPPDNRYVEHPKRIRRKRTTE